jgi:hypothetical protein
MFSPGSFRVIIHFGPLAGQDNCSDIS